MGGAVSSFVDFVGGAFEETVTFRDLGVFRILDSDRDMFRAKLVNEFAKWVKSRKGNPLNRLIYEKTMLMARGRTKALGFTANAEGTIKTITVKNIEEALSNKYGKTISIKKKEESTNEYRCVCRLYKVDFSNFSLTAEKICSLADGALIDSSLDTKWIKKSCLSGVYTEDSCSDVDCDGAGGDKYIFEITKETYWSTSVRSYLYFFIKEFKEYVDNKIRDFGSSQVNEDIGIFTYEDNVFPFFYNGDPLMIQTDNNGFLSVDKNKSTYYFYNLKNKSVESITTEKDTDSITLSDDKSYSVISVKVNNENVSNYYTIGKFPITVKFNEEIGKNSDVEIEYKFIDLNKKDTEVSINIPVNKQAIACICEDEDGNEINEVFYQDDYLETIGGNEFLFIPLKQRGKLVNTKPKYRRLLKDMGIEPDILIDGLIDENDESDGIGSASVKEAVITIGASFGERFDDMLNMLYGRTNEEKKSITIGDGTTDITFFNGENCYVDNNTDEHATICNPARKMKMKIGDNSYYTNNNYDNGIFPVPIQAFMERSKPLRDFYDNYKHNIVMFVYASESTKLKFWQTSMFQFLTFAIGVYLAPITTLVSLSASSLLNNSDIGDRTKLYIQIAVIAYGAYSYSGSTITTTINYTLSANKMYLLISQYQIAHSIEEYNEKTRELQEQLTNNNDGVRIYMPFENIDEFYKMSIGEYDYDYDKYFKL